MSRKTVAKHSIVVANNKLGGAGVTKKQRSQKCQAFITWAFKNGYLFNSVETATKEAVHAYINEERTNKNTNATLHNKLSAIRRVMSAHRKNPDALGITAEEMGLEPRDRKGTKEPIPDAVFQQAVDKAIQIGEPGLAIALRLQRLLGHRGLESLMSIRALEKCALEASESLEMRVDILHGTKGGKYRTTDIIQARARETLEVIRNALVYAKNNNGHLIQGSKNDLKSAVSRYHRLAAEVGLVGIYAPHSLRYAYIVEKICEMRDAGLNKNEALSAAAQYLGHGKSRGRYVTMVYGKTVVHTLKSERHQTRLVRAIDTINSFIDSAQLRS